MQQKLTVLLLLAVGVLNACAPSGNRGVQFTEPAKCQENGVKLTEKTSADELTPTSSGYDMTDGKATMKITCTPDATKAAEMKLDGTAATGLQPDPTTQAIEIEVTCDSADNKWMYLAQEVMAVSCTQA